MIEFDCKQLRFRFRDNQTNPEIIKAPPQGVDEEACQATHKVAFLSLVQWEGCVVAKVATQPQERSKQSQMKRI